MQQNNRSGFFLISCSSTNKNTRVSAHCFNTCHQAVRTAALWEAALTFSELAVNDALSSLDTGAAEDTAKHQTSLTVLYPLYAESSREVGGGGGGRVKMFLGWVTVPQGEKK